MMYNNSQVVNQALMIGMNMGMKIGGEIAKTVLLTALEKVKETKENKTGLTSLKNLLKSKDEVLEILKRYPSYFESVFYRLNY